MHGRLTREQVLRRQPDNLSLCIYSLYHRGRVPALLCEEKKVFKQGRKRKGKKREGKGKKLTQNEEKQGHELRGEDREEKRRGEEREFLVARVLPRVPIEKLRSRDITVAKQQPKIYQQK